ncbi:MAG: PA14 domain-containing protein [Caldilinea sp.]
MVQRIRIPTLLLLLILLCTALPAATHAAPTMQSLVTVETLTIVRLRQGPGQNFDYTFELPFYTGCQVTGRSSDSYGETDWFNVYCDNYGTGWLKEFSNGVQLLRFTQGSRDAVPWIGGVQPTAPAPWRAEFFSNRDLRSDPGSFSQAAEQLNFNWGHNGPVNPLSNMPPFPVDDFSARFTRTFSNLAPGNYRISARVDDGVRIFVNNRPEIDDWRLGSVRTFDKILPLAGDAYVVVEYFEQVGEAILEFSLTPVSTNYVPPAPSSPPASNLPIPTDSWRVQYFNGTSPVGTPAYETTIARAWDGSMLSEQWGPGGPPGVASDYFFVRYEGKFWFEAGDYRFTTHSDDGVRVWVNDLHPINKWWDGWSTETGNIQRIGPGYHTVRIEYYEKTGDASIKVWWAPQGPFGCASAGQCPKG